MSRQRQSRQSTTFQIIPYSGLSDGLINLSFTSYNICYFIFIGLDPLFSLPQRHLNCSIHSNQHASLCNIILRFLHASCVCHFMSSGVFQARKIPISKCTSTGYVGPIKFQPLYQEPPYTIPSYWETMSLDALALACTGSIRVNFAAKQLRILDTVEVMAGMCSSFCSPFLI